MHEEELSVRHASGLEFGFNLPGLTLCRGQGGADMRSPTMWCDTLNSLSGTVGQWRVELGQLLEGDEALWGRTTTGWLRKQQQTNKQSVFSEESH